MLTTYQRLLDSAKVTRHGGSLTMDNRAQDDLIAQLQAEVEALRRALRQAMKETVRYEA